MNIVKTIKSRIDAIGAGLRILTLPKAPAHFQPSPEQLGILERHGIRAIVVRYSEITGQVTPQLSRKDGVKGGEVADSFCCLLNGPMLIRRQDFARFAIQVGQDAHSLHESEFRSVLQHVLDAAVAKIEETERRREELKALVANLSAQAAENLHASRS